MILANVYNLLVLIMLLVLANSYINCTHSKVDDLPDTSSYQIVGTNQITNYNSAGVIATPGPDDIFYGQDANYSDDGTSYTDNGEAQSPTCLVT